MHVLEHFVILPLLTTTAAMQPGRKGALRAPSTHTQVVAKDLMAMKVTELKEELAARNEAVSGNKAWLRRRLHAAIVREYVDGAMGDEGE